jgi:hypothetical protein
VFVFLGGFVDDVNVHFEFGSAYFLVEGDSAGGLVEEFVGLEPPYAGDDF